MKFKGYLKRILIILAFPTVFYGCSSSNDGGADTEAARVEPVRTLVLDYSNISRSITINASLHPYREVHLASAAPGRIEKVHVQAGTRVSQGQLLVEMDKTQLHQAEVQLNNIEKDYRRLDTLRQAGSVSQQQYDQLRTQYDVTLSNVEFLKDNTTLTAPFSGTVSGKYYEDGEMFSGAPNTASGKAAILSLVQTTRLKAIVNISERYYPHIKTGMPVNISSDVYMGEIFKGTVLRVYPTIDPNTRTFTIELSVPNEDEKLLPGMFARAVIELDQDDAFVVPALAVLKLQGSNERYVYLNENGKASRVVVEMGERYDDLVEIISDRINPGASLIIAGQARLLDGMAVEVQN